MDNTSVGLVPDQGLQGKGSKLHLARLRVAPEFIICRSDDRNALVRTLAMLVEGVEAYRWAGGHTGVGTGGRGPGGEHSSS